MQEAVGAMRTDLALSKLLKPAISITDKNISNNPAFLRQFLGTILALTSGSIRSRELGMRIDNSKNPTTW